MIWSTLLIRTWNGAAPADDPTTPEDETVDCGGANVPPGFEGLHFFDVSDPANPDLIHSVDISDARICLGGGRNVVIRKVRNGPDRTIARTTTNGQGEYSVRHNEGGAGNYYAVARAQTFVEDIDEISCTMGQSATKRFGR